MFKKIALALVSSPQFWIVSILLLLALVVVVSEKLPVILSNYTIF